MPHMMDQAYTPKDDPSSFLIPRWEEEALGAKAFQEPPESPAGRAINERYRVPLISQEQAYANHGLQVNQVTAVDDGPSTAAPLPPREAHWGLCGRSQEQGPSPRRTEQGVAQR